MSTVTHAHQKTFLESEGKPKVGERYKDYKGNIVQVVGYCMLEETMEICIVYTNLSNTTLMNSCITYWKWNTAIDKLTPRYKRL